MEFSEQHESDDGSDCDANYLGALEAITLSHSCHSWYAGNWYAFGFTSCIATCVSQCSTWDMAYVSQLLFKHELTGKGSCIFLRSLNSRQAISHLISSMSR